MNKHTIFPQALGSIAVTAAIALSVPIATARAGTLPDIPVSGNAIHRLGPVGQHGWGETDLDGDGRADLVTSSSGPVALINVYGRIGGSSAIGPKQHLMRPPGSITALATAPTGDTRVITVSPDGVVTRYGSWPLAPIGSFNVAHAVTVARIGDIDADGVLELVCAGEGRISAYALPGGALKWSISIQATDIALAALDADPALEIIIAGGDSEPGYVLDGATLMADWSRRHGFGTYLAAGTFGDGLEPGFVAAREWDGVSGYSVAPYALDWSIANFDTDRVAAGDTDADGRDEFAVGDGQWGGVRVYDAPTRQMLYTFPNADWGMWALGMLDLDADSRAEVWYSARIEQSSNFEEEFAAAIMNPVTALPRLVIENYQQGATATLLADIDQDGQHEWIMGTSHPNAYKGLLREFDATTREERWRAPFENANSFLPFQMTYRSVHAAQLDDDAALELVVVGGNGALDFRILVVDGITHAVERQIPTPTTRLFKTVTTSRLVQHVPGGSPELLVASHRYDTAENVRLEAYSLPAGELLWSSPTVGSGQDKSLGMDVGQLDNDPSPEYLLVHTRGLTAFDAGTGQTQWSLPIETQGAVIVSQQEGGEIYSFKTAGEVTRYDSATLLPVGEFSLPAPFEQLARLPGRDDWLLAVAGERVMLIDLDGNVLRESGWIAGSPGVGDNLSIVREGSGWRISIGRSFATFQMWLVETDSIFAHAFE